MMIRCRQQHHPGPNNPQLVTTGDQTSPITPLTLSAKSWFHLKGPNITIQNPSPPWLKVWGHLARPGVPMASPPGPLASSWPQLLAKITNKISSTAATQSNNNQFQIRDSGWILVEQIDQMKPVIGPNRGQQNTLFSGPSGGGNHYNNIK